MIKNVYTHKIDLKVIKIKNSKRTTFANKIIKLPYRGYKVENISDGRKIVITKPGGKSVYGRPKKEDFLVFIYNPKNDSLWQISHKQIFTDLINKAEEDPKETLRILRLFEKVYEGKEPDDVIKGFNVKKLSGENYEAMLKAYKWIWGQEDVNYPTGKGRDMSMEGIKRLIAKLEMDVDK